MNAIGLLVTEHRLIERMVKLLSSELEREKTTRVADTIFLRDAVDFFKNYADKLHHGKEEDILFLELGKKSMDGEHRKMMERLIAEHKIARENVGGLLQAAEKHEKGDGKAIDDAISHIERLVALYPPHIENEDRRFFVPVMRYFTKDEQERLLSECYAFDAKMNSTPYSRMVEKYEKMV